MKQILLTQGYYALVDDEDFDRLNQHKWHCNHGYAVRNPKETDGKRKGKIWMHREVMPPEEGKCTDHINGDTLDNQKHNLRVCTLTQNQWNSKLPKTNTSGYKNISWNKENKNYRVTMRVNKQRYSFGCYKNLQDAINRLIEIQNYHGNYDRNKMISPS